MYRDVGVIIEQRAGQLDDPTCKHLLTVNFFLLRTNRLANIISHRCYTNFVHSIFIRYQTEFTCTCAHSMHTLKMQERFSTRARRRLRILN